MAQLAGQASLRPLFKLGKQKSREAPLLWVRLAAADLTVILISEQLGGEHRSLHECLSAILQIPRATPGPS